MFSVVELAAAATEWLRRGGDFDFTTMEADESPFLWVRLVSGGCDVGAAWEEFRIEEPVPLGTVQRAFDRFATEIPDAARFHLGIDVSGLVRGAG